MKKHNLNKYSKSHHGDYIIMCDICGMPCWASQATRLDTYTGRGGLMVCPRDKDPIDYGLVPYKVPPEKSPPVVRTNDYMNTTITDQSAPLTDYNTDNPLNTTPQLTWENLNNQTWGEWNLPWGS